jgi:hypothetical protein
MNVHSNQRTNDKLKLSGMIEKTEVTNSMKMTITPRARTSTFRCN